MSSDLNKMNEKFPNNCFSYFIKEKCGLVEFYVEIFS